MANPEKLRKHDQTLPKSRRKYPQSRVTQALWLLVGLVLLAGLLGLF